MEFLSLYSYVRYYMHCQIFNIILRCIFIIIFICSSNDGDAIISKTEQVGSGDDVTVKPQKEETKGILFDFVIFCFKYTKYVRIFSFL